MSLKFDWKMPEYVNPKQAQALSKQIQVPPFISQLLINRGVNTKNKALKFLRPTLKDLDDPFKLHDMQKGTTRIKKAIKNHEKIVIYGDYDADGITSVSIMFSLLTHLHANVSYFLPDRFKDGYGPNMSEYQRFVKAGTKLLITTDNGISGYNEVGYARKNGMDVIITDHHDFPAKLPNANAIIMEKFPNHEYDKGQSDFCGAGIAFKVAQAMLGRVPTEYLDIATLGTIADSVNLRHENRIIVACGLKKIRNDMRNGVRALAGISDTDLSKTTSTDLQFSLIPRLNAIGRMSNPNPAVTMLTTKDPHKALAIAEMIEQFNTSRKSIMHQETKEALEQANEPKNREKVTLVLYSKNWFPGVVGIIASRVIEETGKPTIVIGHLSADDKRLIDRGSGRSIPEFNLFKALDPLQKGKHPVMTSFGGHPGACGLSIKPYNIQALADGLERAGQKAGLDKVRPTVKPDIRLTPKQISRKTLRTLSLLEPFGMANEAPLIDLRLKQIFRINQMGGGNSLRFNIGPSYRSVKVVAFGMGDKAINLENYPFDIELAGVMNINHWRGKDSLQFQVKNMRRYTPPLTTNEIKSVYKYLYVRKNISFGLAYSGLYQPIGDYLNVRPDKVKAIIQIFKELKLMYIDKMTMNLVIIQNPSQCKLFDSKTYRDSQR